MVGPLGKNLVKKVGSGSFGRICMNVAIIYCELSFVHKNAP